MSKLARWSRNRDLPTTTNVTCEISANSMTGFSGGGYYDTPVVAFLCLIHGEKSYRRSIGTAGAGNCLCAHSYIYIVSVPTSKNKQHSHTE